MSDRYDDDLFLPNGRVNPCATDDNVAQALRDSLGHARSTNWDSVRTPHLFMGLLGVADGAVYLWAKRLGADPIRLLDQFRELFTQDAAPVPPMVMNREFLSDNVIRLLRESFARAADHGRDHMTAMDIIVTIFSAPNSIVAECFERIGVAAERLLELAVGVEQEGSMS